MNLALLITRSVLQLGFLAFMAAQSSGFSAIPTGPSSSKNPQRPFVPDGYSHNNKSHTPRLRAQSDDPKGLSPAESKRIIAGSARQVIVALKAGNMAKFSTFVHPRKGVRFSPYASVLPDDDRVIRKDQLMRMWASPKRHNWGGGGYDGSGDPIWLTFKNYHGRFIFDHDFSRAKSIAYNPETMSHGNTPNNIRALYPQAIAVEYYFPGFDSKRSGMDWSSLWLVFEKKGSVWYVVGIVHDEWTI